LKLYSNNYSDDDDDDDEDDGDYINNYYYYNGPPTTLSVPVSLPRVHLGPASCPTTCHACTRQRRFEDGQFNRVHRS